MKEDVKLARWLNDEMDDRELKEFMSSPEFETYRKIKEYSAQLTVPAFNMDALYTAIEERKNKGRVRRLNPWIGRVAAILVIALGLTFFYTTHTTTQVADAGQRTEFLLPDNSQVVLNAGSEADFKSWNWDNNRKVELDGEAYFKVAKGKKFDVVTNLGTVTVVGTQFNVKARENRFDVTCFEGKVKVTYNGKAVLLTPGKSIAFENGKNIAVPVDNDRQPGWLKYEVDFKNERLGAVVAEMERQYKVDIEIPQALQEELVNMTVKMNDIDTALDNIETIYHLKSEKAGNKIILASE